MKKICSWFLIIAMLVMFMPLSVYASTAEVIYEQSFESESLPDGWTVASGKSTVASEILPEGITAQDGNRALRAGSNAAIEKSFSGSESLENAQISFWVYDDMSDTATAVMSLSGTDLTGIIFGLSSVTGWNNKYYSYRFANSGAGTRTSVERTLGWHKFTVDFSNSNSAVLSIDDNEVVSLEVSGVYDKIVLGALWHGANTENNVYIDDLAVTRVYVPENLLYMQSFESDDLPAGWSVASGKSTLSSEVPVEGIEAKEGKKALKLGTNAVIEKSFIGEESIDFSVISFWIYDDMSTNAAAPVSLSGDSQDLLFGIYQSRCANNYTYRLGDYKASFVNTKVARTLGWHEFKIDLTNTGKATLSIDGEEVAVVGNIGTYNKISIGAPWYGCNSENNLYVDYLTIEKDKDAVPNPDVESWHFYNSVSPWKNADTNTTEPVCSEYSVLSTSVINQSSKAGITADVTLYPQQASVMQINVNPGTSEKMKLTFTTYYSANDLRDTTIWFDVTPNEYKTYTFAMSNLATWTNTIKKLTFSFPQAQAGETIYVDWIKAMNDQLIHQGVEYTEFTPDELPVERDFRVAYHFSDNMVLQRNKKVNIWGVALEGEQVTVSFNGQTKTATTGADLKWQVSLDPMSASQGLTMTISGDKDDTHVVELTNVCVGEVWVLFGQSNTRTDMTASSATSKADAAAADYPNIRYARVRTTTSAYGLVSNTKAVDNVTWEIADEPGAVTTMAGVAFYYATELYQELIEKEGTAVPIGIVSAGVSATNTEAWLPKEELANIYTPEELEERASNSASRANFTSAFYNGIIYPMAPMTFRGFIWYQGESSADTMLQATHHYEGLHSLIDSYRRLFEDQELAFLVVQLPGYNGYAEKTWAYIRESQMIASQHIDNVGLAVTVDTDETDNLHPANKDLVGDRLCKEAMRMVYGDSSVLAAPLYQSMEIQNGKIILNFKNVGDGLSCPDGQTLTEFEICGTDGVLYPAEAKIISKNQVEVSSSQVTEPKNVYYAFRNPAVGNLYNSDNIQASPFRTDMPTKRVEGNIKIPCELKSAVLTKNSEEIENIENGDLTCNVNLDVKTPSAEISVVLAVYENNVLKELQIKKDFEYMSDGSRQYSFEQTVENSEGVTFKVITLNHLEGLMPVIPSISFI